MGNEFSDFRTTYRAEHGDPFVPFPRRGSYATSYGQTGSPRGALRVAVYDAANPEVDWGWLPPTPLDLERLEAFKAMAADGATVGYTWVYAPLVIVAYTDQPAFLRQVLMHELGHQVVYEALGAGRFCADVPSHAHELLADLAAERMVLHTGAYKHVAACVAQWYQLQLTGGAP